MDYRQFIGRQDERVLPWLGGGRLLAPGRVFRIQDPPEPGWYRFRIRGRDVVSWQAAEPDDALLESLPAVRGHLSGGRLCQPDGRTEPVRLLSEWEPARFAPLLCRRWVDEQVLFHREEFEQGAEEECRRAWEQGLSLEGVKAVPASLRGAFALGILDEASQRLGIPFASAEVQGRRREVASGGREVADRVLVELRDRRAAWALRSRLERVEAGRDGPEEARPGRPMQEERVGRALDQVGARLVDLRRRGDLLEVRWSFWGTELISQVNPRTLNVVDAGICLEGADSALSLESLPGVVQEAIDGDLLVITRRSW